MNGSVSAIECDSHAFYDTNKNKLIKAKHKERCQQCNGREEEKRERGRKRVRERETAGRESERMTCLKWRLRRKAQNNKA